MKSPRTLQAGNLFSETIIPYIADGCNAFPSKWQRAERSGNKGKSYFSANSFKDFIRRSFEMEQNKMRAIFAEAGKEPCICELSIDGNRQQEEICDLLGGNYGATEFFAIQDEISLFILTNDLSAALKLPANRRFPGEDHDTIIYGNAIFIAAYNDRAGENQEGTLDMPEEICQMFIEQIKLHFTACNGDEQPSSEEEVYYEESADGKEIAYKWLEIEKPAKLGKFIEAGRVRFYDVQGDQEIMSLQERYFRKVQIHTKESPLS